jgi:hypothetical protein
MNIAKSAYIQLFNTILFVDKNSGGVQYAQACAKVYVCF